MFFVASSPDHGSARELERNILPVCENRLLREKRKQAAQQKTPVSFAPLASTVEHDKPSKQASAMRVGTALRCKTPTLRSRRMQVSQEKYVPRTWCSNTVRRTSQHREERTTPTRTRTASHRRSASSVRTIERCVKCALSRLNVDANGCREHPARHAKSRR